jgi:hypothetical protein
MADMAGKWRINSFCLIDAEVAEVELLKYPAH